MHRVIYHHADGKQTIADVDAGISLMQAARNNNVPGIEGECGGGLSCATCHVYVAESWFDKLPPMAANEQEMLEIAASERRPNSRLSCQLTVGPELDGIEVFVPEIPS